MAEKFIVYNKAYHEFLDNELYDTKEEAVKEAEADARNSDLELDRYEILRVTGKFTYRKPTDDLWVPESL